MKKIIALLLTLVVAMTCFSYAVFAEEAPKPVEDGFDFYSMTVHYKENVVVGYKYTSETIEVKDHDGNPLINEKGEQVTLKKGYLWDDPRDTYIVPIVKYNKNGVCNQMLSYGEAALKENKNNKDLFYAIVCKDLGIDSAKLSITKTFGLTNIKDGDVITLKDPATVYGVMAYYDDAGTPNPNFTKKDGYFVDKEVDAEGNNLRIDDNGFKIDKNGIWHSVDGHRVEAFVEVGEDFYWINPSQRVINGKVATLDQLTGQFLIDNNIMTMPKAFEHATDEIDETYDYNGDGTVGGNAKDKAAWKTLKKERDTWLKNCAVSTFVIDYQDYDGDGKKTEKDQEKYNAADTVFTGAEIMKKKQADGTEIPVYGTPATGTPLTKVEIDKITVEIDALGTQMYDNVESDPQQQNEVYVTFGDLYQNIKLANDYIKDHPEKMYDDGGLIGSAKCVTTKTEPTASNDGVPETVKSVDLKLEEGVEIPANAMLYFNFVVKTSQESASKSYLSKTAFLTLNRLKVEVEKLPDAPKAPKEPAKKGCKSSVSCGIAVVAVLACGYVALRKKED